MRHLPFVALLLILGACSKPKVGDSCKLGQAACQDPATELQCQKGQFVAAPCKGPKGCTVVGDKQDCDISGNAVGDVCSSDDEDVAQCLADGKSRIVCKGSKYVVERCRGPKGCQQSDTKVECDATLGEEGDECEPQDVRYECSVDKKKTLRCSTKDKKLVVAENCRGPAGCASAKAPVCDRGDQNEGDPCLPDQDLHCAPDKKTKLACENHKWVAKEKCKRACLATAKNVDCDRSTPEPGDACALMGDRVCDADKKLILACNEKKEWATESECKSGCVVTGAKPRCGP